MIPAFDYPAIMQQRWEQIKPLSLTIVAIANRNVPGHEQAINATERCVPYRCQRLMISPTPPMDNSISWIRDPDWGDGRKRAFTKLGEWTLKKLANVIKTEAVILVQADGHALHDEAWTDEFFQYDYIGAPWPLWATLFMQGSMFRRVGGAGFSYRSRRFLEETARIDYSPDHYWMEDIYTSRVYHRALERAGMRFAPVDVALRWCIEYRLEDYPSWKLADSFGQHGFDKRERPLHQLSHVEAFCRAVARKLTRLKP